VSDWDLSHVPRVPPRIVETNPAAPPAAPVPGLSQKISLPPTGVARAIFEELAGPSRKIPFQADECLIRPGRSLGASNTFELPAIGEGGMVNNNKKLDVINLTRNAHKVFWRDPVDGTGVEIELNGVGSNASLRVIAGRWCVVGLFKATET
jgi:hypothetical protein